MVSISEPVVVLVPPRNQVTKGAIASRAVRRQRPAATNGRQNSRLFLGCLLVAGIGFTAFCLLKRSRKQVEASTPMGEKEQLVKAGAKRYINKETWAIKWNEDGLPVQVIIERDAVQK